MMSTTSSTSSTVTIHDSMDSKGSSKLLPQLFATFAATVSAFCMGTVEAYTSPGLPSMKESGRFGELLDPEQSRVASLALLAALISGPPIGFLMGRIGRKVTLIILAIPFVAGWLMIATSVHLNSVYFGRLLTGFCAGAASLVVPIYIGECAEDSVRGMLCSGFQVMVTLGNLFVYVLGSYVDWQWLAFTCGMFPIFGLLMMVSVPSSPRFLLSRGKVTDGSDALARLRGNKSIDVEVEFLSMKANVETCNEEKKSYKDVFKMRTMRPLSISLLLLFFQQMTGIEVVLVYTVYLFTEGGGEDFEISPNQSTILIGTLQVIATCVSAFLVDRSGRRILLMISGIGTAFSMLTLAVFFYLKDNDPTVKEKLDWIPLASLSIFIIFFAICLGPVPFLIVAELNSPAFIGIVSASATTFNWTFAYLATAFFMEIQSKIGIHYCFGIFSVVSLIGAIFVYFFLPETKGISIEEIQNYFRKPKDERQR